VRRVRGGGDVSTLGSAGCQPAIAGNKLTVFALRNYLVSASCRDLQASSLRSPESETTRQPYTIVSCLRVSAAHNPAMVIAIPQTRMTSNDCSGRSPDIRAKASCTNIPWSDAK
jgi:hypothetical protein